MKFDELSGLELLKNVKDGKIPPPSMTGTIPMKLVEAEYGKAVFEAEAGKGHLNPMGTVHGGFAATVLDSATGCAVHSTLGPGDQYVTVDLNVKMLRPVPRGVVVVAEATVVHVSGRLGVSSGELKSPDGELLAHATATCMIKRKQTNPDGRAVSKAA